MSKLFSKHHLCFFKLKCPTCPTCSTTPLSPPHPHHREVHHTPTPSPSSTSTTFNHNHSDTTPAPDFAAVLASHRFFFSSPGHSNSIIPSTTSNSADVNGAGASITRDSIVVPMYSLNPYVDFRRSMQEMIESRESDIDVWKDWDYLHDLLLCYLALNPTRSHKYIIGAFTDVVVDLLSSSEMAEPNHDQQNSLSEVEKHG